MRVERLPVSTERYSSNIWLLRGDFNNLADVNTLIDTGEDPAVVDHLRKINLGAGKKRIAKVVITHNHFDHTGGLSAIRREFNPEVIGFSSNPIVDRQIQNGDILHLADRQFEVIHCPEHSHDSILLYGWEDKVLFSGDTPIAVTTTDATYNQSFVNIFRRLTTLNIQTIYPGHGPTLNNAEALLEKSFHVIEQCTVI